MTQPVVVAALYIDPRGPYPKMAGVDCWDEQRDARLYDGLYPIVAHPPCGAWANLRHLSRGAGKDCGPRAVEQVRKCGGVLEQPAGSKLWDHCRLPRQDTFPDAHDGFSVAVEQCAWGHVARKKTWLYCVGVDYELLQDTLLVGGTPTHWVSGGRNQMRKGGKAGGGCVPPGIKVCSAQQRRRTPVAFAEWLVMLARSSQLTAAETLESIGHADLKSGGTSIQVNEY